MKSIFLNHLNHYLLVPLILILLIPDVSVAMTFRPLGDRVLVTFGTSEGREHTIQVIGFSHEVISPRDAASGLPTGKRQHKPLNITKEMDRSSLIFSKIFFGDDTFTHLSLQIIRDINKVSHVIKTIKLHNADVIRVSVSPASDGEVPLEEFSFNYERISWTWHHKDGDSTKIEDTWIQEETSTQ